MEPPDESELVSTKTPENVTMKAELGTKDQPTEDEPAVTKKAIKVMSKTELRELAKRDKKAQTRKKIEEKKQFIKEVQKRRAIWDRRNPKYRHKTFVDDLWTEVAETVQQDKQTCKKFWKHLIDHFRGLLITLHYTAGRDDMSNKPQVTWPYFESMLFMKNILGPRKAKQKIGSKRGQEKMDAEAQVVDGDISTDDVGEEGQTAKDDEDEDAGLSVESALKLIFDNSPTADTTAPAPDRAETTVMASPKRVDQNNLGSLPKDVQEGSTKDDVNGDGDLSVELAVKRIFDGSSSADSTVPVPDCSEPPTALPLKRRRPGRPPKATKRKLIISNDGLPPPPLLPPPLPEINREQNTNEANTDRPCRFTKYLSELLRSVPLERRRRCENDVLKVVNAHADGQEIVVAVVQQLQCELATDSGNHC